MISFSAMVNSWSFLYDEMNNEEDIMSDDPLDKLSEDTGVARDKFKESTDDVDTDMDAASD